VSKKIKISIIKGVEGDSLYIADYRVSGSKPWGGGTVTAEWEVSIDDLKYALAIFAEPSVQPGDMKDFCEMFCPLGNSHD